MDLKNFIPSLGKKSVPAKREEQYPFLTLQREMNNFFDSLLSGWDSGFLTDRSGSFNPRIEVAEDEKAITVSAELPGMNERDIEVSLTRDTLTIKGEKKNEKEDRREDSFYSERSYGSFSRAIPLPREIDSDKVQARFKKGILTITLPKTVQPERGIKKIAVKVS